MDTQYNRIHQLREWFCTNEPDKELLSIYILYISEVNVF